MHAQESPRRGLGGSDPPGARCRSNRRPDPQELSMSTSLFDPPPREPAGDPPPWSSRGGSEPPAPEGPARVRDVGRRSLAVLLVSAAALGGVAGTGALALAGAFDDGGGAHEHDHAGVHHEHADDRHQRARRDAQPQGALRRGGAPASSTSPPRAATAGRRRSAAAGAGHRHRHRLRGRPQGHIVTAAHVVDGAPPSPSSSRTARRAPPGCSARTTRRTSPCSRSTPPA